jgi:hypothetical protein
MISNEELAAMVKTGRCAPYEIDEEAIRALARELLRVRLVVKEQAPAFVLRGQRYLPEWAIAVLHNEGGRDENDNG